ncbi:DUF5681 domain-containing protein [Viscerimonas tarda]
MAQPKGKTGNPNGRPKGSPNRTTTEVRQWLSRLIEKNRRQIERDLKAIEPKDRLLILEKFMSYTVPKMQSIQAQVDFNNLTDEQLDNLVLEITQNIEENENQD